MTHPPCLRLCPAYPGNPRYRIEGESPLQGKGHTVFKSLLIQQRNGLVVDRLWDRLQIGVDIREIVVRQDRLGVGRHGAIAAAQECRERLDRNRVRRELRAGDATLPLRAVALPAAVLDESGLALLGRGSERSAAAEEEAGGERRQPYNTNK